MHERIGQEENSLREETCSHVLEEVSELGIISRLQQNGEQLQESEDQFELFAELGEVSRPSPNESIELSQDSV